MNRFLVLTSAFLFLLIVQGCSFSPACTEPPMADVSVAPLAANALLRTDGYYYCVDACDTEWGATSAVVFYADGSLLNLGTAPTDSVAAMDRIEESIRRVTQSSNLFDHTGAYALTNNCLVVEQWYKTPWCGYMKSFLVGEPQSDTTLMLTQLREYSDPENYIPSCEQNESPTLWRFQPLADVPAFTNPFLD